MQNVRLFGRAISCPGPPASPLRTSPIPPMLGASKLSAFAWMVTALPTGDWLALEKSRSGAGSRAEAEPSASTGTLPRSPTWHQNRMPVVPPTRAIDAPWLPKVFVAPGAPCGTRSGLYDSDSGSPFSCICTPCSPAGSAPSSSSICRSTRRRPYSLFISTKRSTPTGSPPPAGVSGALALTPVGSYLVLVASVWVDAVAAASALCGAATSAAPAASTAVASASRRPDVSSTRSLALGPVACARARRGARLATSPALADAGAARHPAHVATAILARSQPVRAPCARAVDPRRDEPAGAQPYPVHNLTVR